jgi:hypothetical protein
MSLIVSLFACNFIKHLACISLAAEDGRKLILEPRYHRSR